ncbi:MAG: OmpA family protein [Candidatus Binatia bacterium]
MELKKAFSSICGIVLVFALALAPSITQAEQSGSEEEDAAFYVGSGILSLLYFPFKLATCVGTQAVTAVAYTSTYRVPGNFEGGTNGRELGEIARGACTGPWVIGFDQVKEDYGEGTPVMAKATLQEPLVANAAATETPAVKIVEKEVVKEVIKEVPKVVEVERVILPEVAFRFDSAQLTEVGKGTVYLLAQKIKKKSKVTAVVEGHTDYIGTDEYNKKLGLRRAETVKRELVSLGIKPESLAIESFSESRPLIDQKTNWARAVNRRVEIKVQGK